MQGAGSRAGRAARPAPALPGRFRSRLPVRLGRGGEHGVRRRPVASRPVRRRPADERPPCRCSRHATRPNAQYLPFYIIEGDRNGGNPKLNARPVQGLDHASHYPSLYVEYKGRRLGMVRRRSPLMMNWMSRKKRHHPAQGNGPRTTRGLGEEFPPRARRQPLLLAQLPRHIEEGPTTITTAKTWPTFLEDGQVSGPDLGRQQVRTPSRERRSGTRSTCTLPGSRSHGLG